jgi:8-oxo-dGTP pyrophosphatase MutT (NUDIX family)
VGEKIQKVKRRRNPAKLQRSGINREFSVGGVVFKKKNNQILWLIARNNPSKLYPRVIWRLQKGWIDDETLEMPGPISRGEKKALESDLRKTAMREVAEEGGVEAKIVEKVGTSRYFTNSTRGKVLKFVTFYLMEWIKDLPEGFGFETLEVAWLPFEEAHKKLTYEGEKQILKKAKDLI